MRRRHFLVLSAASMGGLLVYSLDGRVSRLAAAGQAAGTIRIPLQFFTEDEAKIVVAATSRIFPSDENGPGAREAGVTIYIDRQLAGPWGRDRHRYTHPPFDDNLPKEFGYQGSSNPRQIYRQGLAGLKGFDQLSPSEQDEKLRAIESSRFFTLLRENTLEGMFCDPLHGGNTDMVGWQLIGFPGPRFTNHDDIEAHYGQAYRPKPETLSQMVGYPVRPSEQEAPATSSKAVSSSKKVEP